MNNEEIMVFDTEEEINNEVNTVDEPIEESGNGIGAVFGAVIALAATGYMAWRYSKSNKRTERQIKKLEKKGYTVTKIEDDNVVEFEEDGTVKFTTNENE